MTSFATNASTIWSESVRNAVLLQLNSAIRVSGVSHISRCFFFFQAEDGIRDSSVTGVQTCALPISPPFVEVGSTVKKGQVLCIIEAMKLMNEIDSEYDGEVVNVYVESGQPVQYGERLFAVRTN